MVQVLSGLDFDSAVEFADAYNKARLANKNNWIFYVGIVNGKQVQIKSFGLWIQSFKVDGLQNGDCYTKQTVKVFKDDIAKAINHKTGVAFGQAIRMA